MKLSFLSLAGLLPLLAACPPSPIAPDSPDAGCDSDAPLESKRCPPCPTPACADAGEPRPGVVDAGSDLAARACANLRAISCSDGRAEDCASVLRTVQAATGRDGKSLFRIDVAKLATATSVTAARAAGARCE